MKRDKIPGHPFYCHCGGKTKVIESRVSDTSMTIRRRRECLRCETRWTTREVREDVKGLNGQFELAAIREQAAIVRTAQAELRRLLKGAS